MSKQKTKTDILTDIGLQSLIKSFLMELLIKMLDNQQFKVLVGEIGNQFDHRSNLALGLAILDRSKLTGKKITAKYIDVAPAILGVFLN